MRYSLKTSLSLAKQGRLCPPPGLEKIPGQDEYLKEHLSKCPYCGTNLSIHGADAGEWERLAEKLSLLKKKDLPAGPVTKGELRWITSGLAEWRDGFYYTPPLVFVTEVDDDYPEIIQVIQAYDDILLAGPGDLILEKNHTGMGNLFLECWNFYTLKSDFLGPPIASLSAEVVAAVDKTLEDPDYLPSWALLPPPMMENDPRIYFRRLEVDVAYTFSSRAASELMDFVSADGANKADDPIDLMARIKEIRGGTSWKQEVKTREEILLAAEFNPSELRMAADDRQRDTGVAKCAVFHDRVLIDFLPVYYSGIEISRSESSIEVSGELDSDSDIILKDTVIMGGWYCHETKQLKMGTRADLDPETNFFYFKFDLPGDTEGELRIAIETAI